MMCSSACKHFAFCARTVIAVFLCVLLTFPLLAAAHGTGASFETTVDEKLIDIGYTPKEPTVDTSTLFDFALFDTSDDTEIAFDSIWVRIHQDREVFFASGITKPAIGTMSLLYTFPAPGTYEISVRYQNKDETIVESSFTLPVKASQTTKDTAATSSSYLLIAVAAVFGVVVGAFGFRLLSRRSRV